MTRWCPACGKSWSGRTTCRDCLCDLVDDPTATVTCRHCGKVCPARMQSCPNCLGELRPDPAAAAEALTAVLAAGHRLPRPADAPAFAAGASCTLLRLVPSGGLVYTSPEGLKEATVACDHGVVVPPLRCRDLDGSVLFRLEHYEAAPRALVAIGGGGAPLATFLQPDALERRLDVRDETSAPVAALVPARGGFRLVETGGDELAVCDVDDNQRDGWVDDDWTLRPTVDRLPLPVLGAVALLLAGKALLGRPRPGAARPEREIPLDEDERSGWFSSP